MYQDQLKANKDRIPIIIGKNGEVRKQLEEKTGTKLRIDSEEGDVFISGKDSFKVYLCKKLVHAISRGFNPAKAYNLLKENFVFELIDIKGSSKKSKSRELRIKSRVIGRNGKSKHLIEQMTDTDICVYGKTIGIIGKSENADLARRAIEMLIRGSKHGNVFGWLERQQLLSQESNRLLE